jgi:hypothetical protein
MFLLCGLFFLLLLLLASDMNDVAVAVKASDASA